MYFPTRKWDLNWRVNEFIGGTQNKTFHRWNTATVVIYQKRGKHETRKLPTAGTKRMANPRAKRFQSIWNEQFFSSTRQPKLLLEPTTKVSQDRPLMCMRAKTPRSGGHSSVENKNATLHCEFYRLFDDNTTILRARLSVIVAAKYWHTTTGRGVTPGRGSASGVFTCCPRQTLVYDGRPLINNELNEKCEKRGVQKKKGGTTVFDRRPFKRVCFPPPSPLPLTPMSTWSFHIPFSPLYDLRVIRSKIYAFRGDTDKQVSRSSCAHTGRRNDK